MLGSHAGPGLAQEPSPKSAGDQSAEKAAQSRPFGPDITIDWDEPAVRVRAKVVLREGPLELFACSPQTREHESILTVMARPLHIFQAMGLIGLESGSPPSYIEKRDQWQQAHGEPLDLRVEWRDGEKTRSVKPGEWMIEKRTGKAPEKLEWVFSGSIVREKGHFGADSDGTVVCVVDFDSALISLPTGHSADDAELWLSANPESIPALGTPCTLIVRSAHHPKLEIEISNEGNLRLAGEEVSVERIGHKLTERRDDRNPHLFVSYEWKSLNQEIRNSIENLKDELRRRELDPAKTMTVKKADPPRGVRTLAPAP
jgi:hypothetical protein